MERRLAKVNIGPAGGTAGDGSKTYKITLPSLWISAMGVTQDNRQVEISFDGESIIVSRYCGVEEFAARKKAEGHDIRCIRYYDGNALCSLIYADFTDETLRVQNFTDNAIKTAFGVHENPDWADFLDFLEERCVPRTRAGIREYLETIGVPMYEPLEIIRKTQGRMAEDQQWMEVEALT